MKIVIVGGGIAGLAAAVCLEREGFEDITLLEQAPEFSEIGAGIQVSNNGARLFREIGLEPAIASTACQSEGNYYFDIESGEKILETVAGKTGEELYGAPFYHIRRTELLRALESGTSKTRFIMDTHVVSVEPDAPQGGAAVTTSDGETFHGDIVIGADGIKSALRATLFGAGDPTFSGYLAWRALIPAEKLEGVDIPRSCTAWWGPERGGVVFWVDNGRYMNFVGTVPSDTVSAESWDKPGLVSDLRQAYAGCAEPLDTVIRAIDEPFLTGIYSRDILQTWSAGNVVLMGDACHPIWPFMANGATMAVEDAYVLARCLARSATPQEAFAEYQERRMQRVHDVARTSVEMADAYHMSGDEARAARNEKMRARAVEDPQGLWLRGWLWGYDIVSDTETPLGERSLALAPNVV